MDIAIIVFITTSDVMIAIKINYIAFHSNVIIA
jgi:hypothetical protein